MNPGRISTRLTMQVGLVVMSLATITNADAPGEGQDATRRRSEPLPAGLEWVHSKPAGVEFTKTEVTVSQYRACVDAGACSPFDQARREFREQIEANDQAGRDALSIHRNELDNLLAQQRAEHQAELERQHRDHEAAVLRLRQRRKDDLTNALNEALA